MFAARRRRMMLWVTIGAFVMITRMGAESAKAAQNLPRFDFKKAAQVLEWQSANDVGYLTDSPDGMVIPISGNDPYIIGPARDYPEKQPLWIRLRFKSEHPGMVQIFYFRQGPSEEDSVRFPARGGAWEEVRLPLPPLGKGFRLRFDPPGTSGKVILASLAFEERTLLKEPKWPVPVPPVLDAKAVTLTSGSVKLLHSRNTFGGFALEVAGQRMAVGHTRPLLGYVVGKQVRWLNLAERARVSLKVEPVAANALTVEAVAEDADGATWTLRQRFSAARQPDAFDVETRVSVSQARNVVYLPLLVLLPGVGAFGESKGQGLFAGLEYLDNEPSSSEADIIGPGSHRQVPDTLKITFPLMAIQAKDHYVGLIWEKRDDLSAVFDSPDRLFRSGGHVLGVLFPGSDGNNRVEGSLLPYSGERLAAKKALTLRATLIGGAGKSVVPAVQQYVALRGLPSVPPAGMSYQDYLATAAAGYLESKIREGSRYRHAYPGDFQPAQVGDVPLFLEWMARETTDKSLAARLETAARDALAPLNPADYNTAGISHVTYPAVSLVHKQAAIGAEKAAHQARNVLGQFAADGSVPYRVSPGRPDFGKTHFASDANGLTSQVVRSALETATACGDPALIQESLRVLKSLDKFANTVPRGAQTWEVPLHTPDVLASAHLVRAYTLGYELTGETHYLDNALSWAWTGVPFLYLVAPTTQPVGLYATIPVLGATHWKAPNWMGLPVQWCGLVYADALYRLVRHDPNGPWKQIADGITASGVQQTWPRNSDPERVGLLPDSVSLRAQVRNDAAINPGTVFANAVRLFGRPEIYDFRVFRATGWMVHAPGAITDIAEKPEGVSFAVQGWCDHSYEILIVGVKELPKILINNQEVMPTAPNHYLKREGRLILRVSGKPTITLQRR